MALLASFQRKFDALECTVDITYSIRLNKKYEAELNVDKNDCPKYLKSGSYKRHFYRSKKYINTLL